MLERKPEITVVDEIAHTNVPGSRNRRRYQDVLALLDAGINVIGAFNIQHLESLNDVVQRVTGVAIRETVPDSFLKRADQVVNLDLAVEDLLERLQAGKIYAADKVPWALEHFFKDRHLATLRELALREVAESLDRGDRRRQREDGACRGGGAAPRGAVTGRVMVCMSSLPTRAGTLLRRGSRFAGTTQHRLVRRLRRDAARGAPPHRRRGPAPPAGQRRERARARRRGGPPQGRRPGRGAARLRALARRRSDHRRPLAGPLVAAAARAHGGRCGWSRRPRGSTSSSPPSTRRPRSRADDPAREAPAGADAARGRAGAHRASCRR